MLRYIAVCILAAFSIEMPFQALADAAKCGDASALSILRNQVDPLVDTASSVSPAAGKIAKEYKAAYSNFFSMSEIENTQDCKDTVKTTTQAEITSDASHLSGNCDGRWKNACCAKPLF